MQQRTIKAGNQNIAYYESEGKGKHVLFIHGNSLSGKAFLKQLVSPLGKRFHLIAIDLPGHGKSDPAAEPESIYTLPGYTSVIVDIVKRLELEDAIFIGWSLGGHILLEASGKLPRASGFVIFGTPPAGVPPDMAKAFLPSAVIPLLFKEKLTDYEVNTWSETLLSRPPEYFRKEIKNTDGRARLEMGKSIVEGRYRDEIEAVSDLSVPLAVLHGENEKIVNLKYLRELSIPTLWRNDVQVIKGSGHTPQWEQPETFNKLIKEFIEDVS